MTGLFWLMVLVRSWAALRQEQYGRRVCLEENCWQHGGQETEKREESGIEMHPSRSRFQRLASADKTPPNSKSAILPHDSFCLEKALPQSKSSQSRFIFHTSTTSDSASFIGFPETRAKMGSTETRNQQEKKEKSCTWVKRKW